MMRSLDKIAKVAASAAITLMLTLGGIAPRTAMAAVGTGTGTITVTTTDNNAGMTYNAYKIFTCDVDATGTTVTDISWASDAMKSAVEDAIQAHDSSYSGTTAQDAATFIRNTITGTTSTTRVDSGSFAETLSQAIDDVTDPAPTVLTAGQAHADMPEGYYLIVSVPDSVTGVKVGTSPIFAALGEGQSLEVGDKASVPTLTKTLVEDSAPSVARAYADAQVGQEVSFTLTGTVPDNIASFGTYAYTFEDQLPEGMTLKLADSAPDVTVTITVAGTTYTVASGYTATSSDGKLTINFANLKAATGTTSSSDTAATIPVDDSAVVTVTYAASLNENAALGTTAGNANNATLKYSNNPQDSSTTGTSTAQTATVYTFGLTLVKVDKENELDADEGISTKLSGAQFIIQATTTDETPTNDGKYLKTDGTFGDATSQPTNDEDYLFTTDANGEISVSGLDAGTYVIHEVTAPTSYSLTNDLVLTLTVTKSDDGKPTAVTATLTGGEGDGVDTNNDEVKDKGTRAAYDSSTGVVTVTATNAKGSGLPLTGLPGITLVYVAGGIILAVSLTMLVRRRLMDQG